MKLIKKFFLFLIILNFSDLNAGFFDYFWPFKKEKGSDKIIISAGVQEKIHQISILRKEKELIEEKDKEFNEILQNELNEINKRILDIKEKLENPTNKDNEILNKILAKLNEIAQVVIDTQLYQKKLLNNLIQNITLLENYVKDPSFKHKSIEFKAAYNFEILQKLHNEIFSIQEELKSNNEEKNNIESSLESLKKEISLLEKEIKIKEREQKKFGLKTREDEEEATALKEKGEYLDLEIRLLTDKKRLVDLKIREVSQRISLIQTQVFINEALLKSTKENLAIVERGLWISEADIENVKKDLAEKKRVSTELQAKYSQEISQLSQEREKLKDEFEKLSKKYNLNPDLKNLSDWTIELKGINSEPVFYELGLINDKISTINIEIALKEAQRELEKKRLHVEETLLNILISWHKISQRKFRTEDEINNERKLYEQFKNDANRELTSYKEQINNITGLLNNHSKLINNIHDKTKSLNQRQEKFTSKYGKEAFRKSIALLAKSEEQVNLQNEVNSKIIETYSTLQGIIKDFLQDINSINAKIESIGGILLRSEYAISWESFKNIIPDLQLFIIDLKNVISSYASDVGIKKIFSNIFNLLKSPQTLFFLFIELFILFLLYILLKMILPSVYSILLSIRPNITGLFFINCLMAVAIGFIIENFLGVYIWSVFLFLIRFDFITDLGFKVLFYLFSIFYLCFLTSKFKKYLVEFNVRNNYILLSPNFQHRFNLVFSFFIYSTIIIFFFRESFLTITYGKSDLSTILLAIYSIIFRACLIFLIGKEEILGLIQAKGPIWDWIRNFINKFYYFILLAIVAIMVISDPYIGGFSKLVSFILWGILFTVFLFIGIWWSQIFIRRISSNIFFLVDEDGNVKERFHHAKTFFGLFSITSFILFALLVIFIGAKIWNIPFSFEKITLFVDKSIFAVRGEEGPIPITLRSFLTIFSFFFFGFVLAWFINRFILRKMFDVLVVEQGVRNTISSISNYLIIIIVLLVGFFRVGLGGLIPFLLGALAVGLAFAIKGPANDFIGYFILLVERSIKIGDYVEIDEDISGVVRKISPRSIVIRKKNSVSVIVPNAKVTNSAFYNWNYVAGFFAFNDIILTVPLNVDPIEVKAILFKVLDQHPDVLKSPNPVIRLDNFSDNGYTFMVRGFLSSVNVLNQWDIASDIRISIVKALREKNIQMASPVRQIFIESDFDKSKK